MPAVTSDDIYQAVHEIFQSMLGVEPELRTLEREEAPLHNQGIAAIVGYAGESEGSVVFTCGLELAAQLAGLMLMEEGLDPESEEVDDAVGEIANMVAGQLKNLVCEGGNEVQLSIPVIVRDGDYRLPVPDSYDRWRLTCFHVDGSPFYVEMVSSEPLE
ncbi:MAG: chemotaxis protein CheX [Nitrospirae bacterium]|nr:MAG: chemotaxis protein CheX [Nitrospirota bacterium]